MEEGSLKEFNHKNRECIEKTRPVKSRQSFKNFDILKDLRIISVVLLLSVGTLPKSVHSKLTISKECGDIICQPHNYCSQIDHTCRPCQIACDPTVGNYDKGVCEKDCQDWLHDLWYMRKPENESDFRDELYINLYYKVQEDLRLLKILIGVVIILSTLVMLALFAIMVYFKRLRNKFQQQSSTNSAYLKKSKKLADYPVIYSNSQVLSLPIPDIHKGPSSNSSSINNNLSRGSSPDLVSRTVTTQASSYLNNPFFHPPSSTTAYGAASKNKKDSSSGLGLRGGGFVMENPGVKTPTLQEKQSRLKKEPSESTLPEYHGYDNPALVPSPVHVHM